MSVDVYQLFKIGFDTLEIAHLTQRPEHEILREINQRRSAERGLDTPYRGFKPKGRAAA